MEKALINKLQALLPQIVSLTKQQNSMTFDYDEKVDVLYISFQKPQAATNSEFINNNLVLRKKGDQLVGVTILHASTY